MRGRGGLRTIACIEATKGLVVLAAGLGALELVGGNVQEAAEKLVSQFHLNPAHEIPRIFVEIAKNATPSNLFLLALGAAAYASVRFVEAYGLWRERVWAEWLGVISGSIYLPWEVWELWRGVTGLKLGLLAVNLAVVGYLLLALKRSRARRAGVPDSLAGR